MTLRTGRVLWRRPESEPLPMSLAVADGLVWVGQSRSRTGPDFVAGRDLHTGEIRRELDTAEAWDTTMPHHRCHRNRAAGRYIIAGRTGVGFIDLNTGESQRHHWTRGTCQFGTLPANGLLYAPPHACACFIEAKLTGFLALAPRKAQNADAPRPGFAGGRIDSPPTVAQGRVVFGAADGYVYCLRAADGQLAWRFRAAPQERRVMAFGQVESAWPVHGSTLVDEGAVYCVAGRSSYLDGGLVLYRLDLGTGRVLAERSICSRDPETGEQPEAPARFEMPGALPDVLSTDGEAIYMRHLAFDPGTLESRTARRHVYSPSGFLNDNWWHRTYWIDGTHFYSGYIGWYFAGHEAPAGRLLVFTDEELYGYAPSYYRGSRGREYNLFALDRAAQPEQPAADYERANRDYPHRGGGKFRIAYRWSEDAPLLVRCMVLTDGKLFTAGPTEEALTRPSVFAGQRGARLAVFSTTDGALLKQFELDALPAYDGMGAAYGRLLLALDDGRLLCFGTRGERTASLSEIKTFP